MNKQQVNQEIIVKAKRIKLLLMDCDGVLTDGRLYFTESGEEIKVFHVRDGQGLVSWHEAGFRSGIISGRNSKIVAKRACELGIEFVYQGTSNKLKVFEEVLATANVSREETAFVGDDIADVFLMSRVGLAIAVADSVKEAKEVAHFVTKNMGGRGAVREATDLLLQIKNSCL
ncbi:MAG: HAD-IIIA family hydrolase [Acidobacteria bacterium]|nr:HAD-IIIA family hydrolase [Acidobacteriota bacterium]